MPGKGDISAADGERGHSSGANLRGWKNHCDNYMLLLKAARVVLPCTPTMPTMPAGCHWLPGEATEVLGEAT